MKNGDKNKSVAFIFLFSVISWGIYKYIFSTHITFLESSIFNI